ncbi:MAG: peptidase M14 [Acidobacteria bacterium]|nr:peptidase M14 [Acidobacteriota bacterium]
MKNKKQKTISFITLSAVVILLAITVSAADVNLSFDHFYDNAELTQALKDLQKAYPQFVKMESLGKSHGGLDIWSVVINNPKTGPAEHKPGYYIDGNIHGNEIQGTEVTLYAMCYLLKNYGKTQFATRLLDERSFYLIPTMNPDSRDIFINKAEELRTGIIPLDEDRDGTADEDPAEDLNGDGFITQMRKKDPDGRLIPHPRDSRILIPAPAGKKGEYIMLGSEGIDNDGDGRINEDGPGGYDMNRNFGYNWMPSYVQMGAGPYPFCWPETIACRDFLIAHPNIMGAQSFHNYGGMILVGPAAPNMGQLPMMDKQVMDTIGHNGEKILPGYRYIIIHKDLYTVYGGTVDFTYYGLGIYTFSNELDMDPFESMPFGNEEEQENMTPEEQEQRQLANEFNELFFHDHVMLGESYVEWKPYNHPLYGEVEIGGVTKFGRRVPSLFQLADTCHRNAAFIFYHADQLPHLEFQKIAVKKLDGDVYQMDVRISNSRLTPSISQIAIQKKIHRADKFTLEGKNVKILAAGYLTDKFRDLTQPIKTQDNFFWVENGVRGHGRIDIRLLVKGRGNVSLTYDSLKGGFQQAETDLK